MKNGSTPARPTDGRDIMLAVASEDPGSFDLLVKTYEKHIKAALRRYISDRRAVEDLSQEVFLRLFRARKRYVPTARFETFLHHIILNLCVNHTHYSRRRRMLPLDNRPEDSDDEAPGPMDPTGKSPIESAILAEQGELVRRAVERLPGNQRRAVILSRYSGMAHEDVAGELGVSPEAVKSLLWRARENLRAYLRPVLAAELPA